MARAIQRQAEMDADQAGIPPRPPAPASSPNRVSRAPLEHPTARRVRRRGRAPARERPDCRRPSSARCGDRRRAERAERMKALATGEALQFDVRRRASSSERSAPRWTGTASSRFWCPSVAGSGARSRSSWIRAARSTPSIRGRRAIEALRLAGGAGPECLDNAGRRRARRHPPRPSGIVFGLAPPPRLAPRHAPRSLGNLAVGLLFIAGAFAILRLASRLTRHLAALNAACSGWRRRPPCPCRRGRPGRSRRAGALVQPDGG